jgi:hypothetical protein
VPTPAAGSSTGAPVAAAALTSTIAGFPSTYVYLGIGALALFLLVKK